VLPATRNWSLFDVAASRAIETNELARHAPGALMQRAGRGVARLALAVAPHARRIWVAAGPGGNGGDGLHAAADLASIGCDVRVTLCADAGQLPLDAQRALQRAQAAGVKVGSTWPEGPIDMAIDALLGIGASRAPEGTISEAIERLNGLTAPRLAVDLPSGISADTGALLGTRAVHATCTLALLTLKPGLFTGIARDHVGDVWLDNLDADAGRMPPCTAILSSIAHDRAAVAPRRHAQHKGSFGDVVVVGGAAGMAGAARLAAHASLAAGAGRTLVSLLDVEAPSGDTTRPEWLWCHAAWLPGRAALEESTVVCGCGGGDPVRTALPALMSRSARLVLDADALNAVAADEGLFALLQARGTRGRATVLTPHPLEAARLLHTTTTQVQHDRIEAARALARRTGAVVVLKGSGTVIAAPGHVPVINGTGNAALATGGTGDVLAGWIAGLWAQATGDDEMASAFASAAASAWRHGAAADAAGTHVVRALDLVDAMRALSSAL
jgi:ADP-dependent NAD(P)H-hydrate dehydratase / NAD(P)H-hydrate epimerase